MWYQPLSLGVFLVLGGAASLIGCRTFVKDELEPPARRLKSMSSWMTIAFDVLLPPGFALIALVASPIFHTASFGAGWAFWQLVLGLVALGVWNYAKRPPFGWIGSRQFAMIVAAVVILLGVAAFGAHTAANTFKSWIAQQERHGPCAIHAGPCRPSVDAKSAQEVATRLGHPIAWLPAGKGVKPLNIRATSDSAHEYASIVGAHLDAFVISYPGRARFCQEGTPCPSRTLDYRGIRLFAYPLPAGTQLELGWTRGHVHYRLTLASFDHTSPTLHQALSLFSLGRYAAPAAQATGQ